jgi:hypothetical protein
MADGVAGGLQKPQKSLAANSIPCTRRRPAHNAASTSCIQPKTADLDSRAQPVIRLMPVATKMAAHAGNAMCH